MTLRKLLTPALLGLVMFLGVSADKASASEHRHYRDGRRHSVDYYYRSHSPRYYSTAYYYDNNDYSDGYYDNDYYRGGYYTTGYYYRPHYRTYYRTGYYGGGRYYRSHRYHRPHFQIRVGF